MELIVKSNKNILLHDENSEIDVKSEINKGAKANIFTKGNFSTISSYFNSVHPSQKLNIIVDLFMNGPSIGKHSVIAETKDYIPVKIEVWAVISAVIDVFVSSKDAAPIARRISILVSDIGDGDAKSFIDENNRVAQKKIKEYGRFQRVIKSIKNRRKSEIIYFMVPKKLEKFNFDKVLDDFVSSSDVNIYTVSEFWAGYAFYDWVGQITPIIYDKKSPFFLKIPIFPE